jgi:hypothetical protein
VQAVAPLTPLCELPAGLNRVLKQKPKVATYISFTPRKKSYGKCASDAIASHPRTRTVEFRSQRMEHPRTWGIRVVFSSHIPPNGGAPRTGEIRTVQSNATRSINKGICFAQSRLLTDEKTLPVTQGNRKNGKICYIDCMTNTTGERMHSFAGKERELFDYMRERGFPVYHLSNLFVRDIESAMRDYLRDRQGRDIGLRVLEKMTREFIEDLRSRGIIEPFSKNTYVLHLEDYRLKPATVEENDNGLEPVN